MLMGSETDWDSEGNRMLAAERRATILQRLRDRGSVRVVELTRLLDVSDMTVRRDLERLARDGLLEKVHGGATAPRSGGTEEPGFEAKSVRERPEKQAIASAAVDLVQPGATVGLSAGTTTWTLAHHLVQVPGITVVTNSVRIAEVLYAGPDASQTVILTGGVRTPSDALVGPVAVGALQALNLDLVFMGVHGMDAHRGFSTPNLQESDTDRAFLGAARSIVVVADHTKWGLAGISTIAALDDADVLVTDDGLDPDANTTLTERVGRLIVAPIQRRSSPISSAAAE